MNTPRVSRLARRLPVARAFTIVEIIVVIVIIGVLATLIAPRLINRIGQAKSSTAQANAQTLATAVESFIADVGTTPSGPSLMFLFERPGDVDATKWHGPYVKNIDQLKDPWGNEFMLIVGSGTKNADFDILSYGADSKPGGEGDSADIINK
ncbi:MAG: type II secretion system major pseudopilin GspG [Phycisphaerales bacterium]